MAGDHALPIERAQHRRSDPRTDFWDPTGFQTTAGFWTSTLVIVILSAALYASFKKRDWLWSDQRTARRLAWCLPRPRPAPPGNARGAHPTASRVRRPGLRSPRNSRSAQPAVRFASYSPCAEPQIPLTTGLSRRAAHRCPPRGADYVMPVCLPALTRRRFCGPSRPEASNDP